MTAASKAQKNWQHSHSPQEERARVLCVLGVLGLLGRPLTVLLVLGLIRNLPPIAAVTRTSVLGRFLHHIGPAPVRLSFMHCLAVLLVPREPVALHGPVLPAVRLLLSAHLL